MSGNVTHDRLATIAAKALGVPVTSIHDELAYAAIPQWDSLNHVNLMVALEEAFGTAIDEDLMVELTSIRAIRSFVAEKASVE